MGKKYNDKVIKALFDINAEANNIKWSFEQLVNSEISVKYLINNFTNCYKHGFEQSEIQNIMEKFVSETNIYYPKFNRLYLVMQLSNKFLNHSYHDTRVKFKNYFDWIGITNKLNEEMIVELLKGMNDDHSISTYLMTVPHDFYSLNKLLFEDKTLMKPEQHMHVNASALNFNFSYFGLAYNTKSYGQLVDIIDRNLNKTPDMSNELILYKTVLLRHLLDILYFNEDELESLKELIELVDDKYDLNITFDQLFEFVYNFDPYNSYCITIGTWIMDNSNLHHDISQMTFSKVSELYEFLDYERSFIRKIVSKYKSHDKMNNHVFMYMYYKNLCHEQFVSKNTRSTFKSFSDKQSTKTLFIDQDPQLVKLYYRSIYFIYKQDNVHKLEWRTKPSAEFKTQFNMIRYISNHISLHTPNNDNDITINPIIHFMRTDFENNCKHSNSHCFCSKLDNYNQMMDNYKIQASNTKILALEKATENFDYRVIGIDAASDELKSSPEIMGCAYRKMRTPNYFDSNENQSANINKLDPIRFTYHVGEVYANILTGIRRVDEVIEYLQFQSGDRIGHGVALGIDVKHEYKTRTSSYQKLGERLDDLVWLYDTLVDTHYDDATNILKLKQEIDSYLSIINNALVDECSAFTLDEYRKSLKLRSDLYTFNYTDLKYADVIQQSHYNKNIFEDFNIKAKGYADAFKNQNAKILYELYRTNAVFCDVYNESIQVKNNINNMVDMVSYAQKKIRRKVASKDITIEINISSNYFISSMNRYYQHPLFVFVPIDKSNYKDSLQVSINTDDSAIFQTSLNREYSIIAKTLISQGYSNIEVCEYIERLIKMSNRTSWIK